MIYVTGDIHGGIDFKKLTSKKFPEGKKLTKQDYVICTGDFGLIFDVNESSKVEKYSINWLSEKPWTTLFVDGNHENFNRLYKLPEISMFNGKVGVVNDSIYHLKRGEIYNIENQKIFVFGGAYSVDKEYRFIDISWWQEEIPSYKEMTYALKNLKKHNNSVDYILTHTCPVEIIKKMNNILKFENKTDMNFFSERIDSNSKFLSEILKIVKFKKWYFSHFHMDRKIDDKFIIQYQDVLKLGE